MQIACVLQGGHLHVLFTATTILLTPDRPNPHVLLGSAAHLPYPVTNPTSQISVQSSSQCREVAREQ